MANKQAEIREQANNLLTEIVFQTPEDAKKITKAFNESHGTNFYLDSANNKIKIKNGKDTLYEVSVP